VHNGGASVRQSLDSAGARVTRCSRLAFPKQSLTDDSTPSRRVGSLSHVESEQLNDNYADFTD